ncbi:MAG: arabinogalactan oligomer / maltooligosaccharide transport system permease protein [Acidobacteriota bacterium]|jgi:arabinogalactan oligomer/maltooligosaccharide transport system permease protein|nr:arabinogalactan oligomer / maltooligosaccharide transport system permease protein [Acidobacteriota bacterium]
MTDPTRPVSHRRRFLLGLAVAALLGVGVAAALLHGAQTAESRGRAQRKAVITLFALADLVDRVGGGAPASATAGTGLGEEIPSPPSDSGGMGLGAEIAAAEQGAAKPAGDPGDAVRRAVARFAAGHPEVKAIRVVDFEGVRLTASTSPTDTGAKAAPRRLERDEKDVYDLGQRLRAAVQNNREGAEGAARQPEISRVRNEDGSLSLAAPVERGGEVVGMVQMDTAIQQETVRFAWLPFLAAWLVPVGVFFLLSLVLGERRGLLATMAALALLGGLAVYGRYSLQVLERERRDSAEAVAAHAAAEETKARGLISEIGIQGQQGPPLVPARWDVDEFRQPLANDPQAQRAADAGRLYRALITLGILGLALLAFVGYGLAYRTGRALVDYRVAYAYTLPAMIGMLVLVFFPFFYGVALSFTNSNLYNSAKPITETWVGVQNYADILSDFAITKRTAEGLVWNYSNFYYTLIFTIVWTVTNVALGVSLGLILALILNLKGFALRPLYRVLLILPWATPNYITSLIFKGMFHQQFGIVNQIIQLFGGHAVAWFDKPLTSFLVMLTTNGWLSFPFMMVISLGALQSIPSDLYEAARVDGATRWQQFTSITLPSLRPALVPAIILSVIWTFNQFNVAYLVSAGQPGGATEILITQSYKIAFEQYRYGYAAAYSVIIFMILFAYGSWQNRVTGATEALG